MEKGLPIVSIFFIRYPSLRPKLITTKYVLSKLYRVWCN